MNEDLKTEEELKRLLLLYIKENQNLDYVKIDYYNVDGTICSVKFYTEESQHYKEHININLWRFIAFINKINNQHILI